MRKNYIKDIPKGIIFAPDVLYAQKPAIPVRIENHAQLSTNNVQVQYSEPSERLQDIERYGMYVSREDLVRVSRLHIPGLKLNWITDHLDSQKFVGYFKRIHPLQELPGMYSYVKRHPCFDEKLFRHIKSQILDTKELFESNVVEASSKIQTNFHINITQEDINDVIYLFCHRVLNWKRYDYTILPDKQAILDSVRKQTSAGGVNPYARKSEMMDEIKLAVNGVYNGTFDCSKFGLYPDVVGSRSQVRSSGLKPRVICMIEAVRQSLENIFRTCFCVTFLLDNDKSEICYGKSQKELSAITEQIQGLNTLSIDFASFDHTIPCDIMVFAFMLIEKAIKLEGYLQYVFRFLRNVTVKSMMFHPRTGAVSRSSGLSSGSSFTNVVGSIVNFLITYLSLFEYCRLKKINFWKSKIICRFSGDDGFIASDFEVNGNLFIKLVRNRFGMNATIEHSSAAESSGSATFFFLGSKWIHGKPHRDVKRLLMQIVFGKGNMPEMSDNVRFLSRGFDIFGNDCNTEDNFLKCGIDFNKLPSRLRLFRFGDHFYSESTFLATLRSSNFESRGAWYTHLITDRSQLNSIWETR